MHITYANKIIKYAKRLDVLVLVSNELKDFYKASLDGSKCRCVYIPNIIDKLPKYLSHLNKKRLISVGRLSEEKGFYDLLEIYKKLTIKHEDWCLDIIGDGPLRTELQEFIDSNNLSDKYTAHPDENMCVYLRVLKQTLQENPWGILKEEFLNTEGG